MCCSCIPSNDTRSNYFTHIQVVYAILYACDMYITDGHHASKYGVSICTSNTRFLPTSLTIHLDGRWVGLAMPASLAPSLTIELASLMHL